MVQTVRVSYLTGSSEREEPTVLRVLPTPGGLVECWALDAYTRLPDGLTRAADLFTKAKYRGLGPPLMVLRTMFADGTVSIARFRGWPSDIEVVPVGSSSPLSLELARAAATALDAPLLQVFRRPSGPKLKDVPLVAREARAAARTTIDPRARCAPDILLIDDLVESGSTLTAAAQALRGIGAERVFAMAAVHIHH